MGKKNLNSFNLTDFAVQQTEQQRVHTVKVNILIVSEGTKTEVNYFKAFPKMKLNSRIVQVDSRTDAVGTGMNTVQVVREADRLVKEAEAAGASRKYDSVWVVFDRDSFDACKFDNAISMAEGRKYGCAWSNEAFELFYLLHFENRTASMSRKDYRKRITAYLSKHIPGFTYEKGETRMYEYLHKFGNEGAAVRFARAGEQLRLQQGTPPHAANPVTTVYKLVEFLNGRDPEFIKKIEKMLTDGT